MAVHSRGSFRWFIPDVHFQFLVRTISLTYEPLLTSFYLRKVRTTLGDDGMKVYDGFDACEWKGPTSRP
jgi:hypothetical protein